MQNSVDGELPEGEHTGKQILMVLLYWVSLEVVIQTRTDSRLLGHIFLT